MYKLVNGILPDVINELYTTNDQIHNHFTGQCNVCHINKRHSNVYARSFRNISPRIWYALQKIYFMEHNLEIMFTK